MFLCSVCVGSLIVSFSLSHLHALSLVVTLCILAQENKSSSAYHLFMAAEPRVHSALHVDSMEEDLVRMASELTMQANQLHEMQLELQRIATTTNQAEERAKVAEEKACAAVTAIGMVKATEQKKTKLNNRDAEKCWPETYTADRVDKKSFAEFSGEAETCAGTRPVGETSAGVGCSFPRPADRVE